jgi:hypothetical protein
MDAIQKTQITPIFSFKNLKKRSTDSRQPEPQKGINQPQHRASVKLTLAAHVPHQQADPLTQTPHKKREK